LILELRSRKYPVITPPDDHERAGIVSFVPGDEDPEAVVARLKDAGVIVSARGPWIRVSPHFYNTDDEIDALLQALGT
jgi:selenocysteine lyase/cysteine desulfurase